MHRRDFIKFTTLTLIAAPSSKAGEPPSAKQMTVQKWDEEFIVVNNYVLKRADIGGLVTQGQTK